METPDLATTPGMPPPAGEVSQFDSPYNSLQIVTFVAFGITFFLATVVLALRYVQAVKLIKKIEMDLGRRNGGQNQRLGLTVHVGSHRDNLVRRVCVLLRVYA